MINLPLSRYVLTLSFYLLGFSPNSFLEESVHNNLRLLSRSTDQYLDEKTKMWDVGGDEFGTMEDRRFLEFVELSFGEPELETDSLFL
ncbi:hypothetical protein Tco_0573112 [Tanacetum coccineum]